MKYYMLHQYLNILATKSLLKNTTNTFGMPKRYSITQLAYMSHKHPWASS